MTKYSHLYTSPLKTNTYIVTNGDRAFVVDPGGEADEIYFMLKMQKIHLDAILLTHAHFDHIAGVQPLLNLADKLYGDNVSQENRHAPLVVMHKDDLDKVGSYKNLGFASGVKVEKFVPDILVSGGETLNIAGLPVKVLHTPGHSKGGVCYVVENKIFVGDTIFFSSYGRTDFYDGSFAQLKNSIINKLFRIEKNYTLLPGHGEPTTLAFEKRYNPIWQDEQTPQAID